MKKKKKKNYGDRKKERVDINVDDLKTNSLPYKQDVLNLLPLNNHTLRKKTKKKKR